MALAGAKHATEDDRASTRDRLRKDILATLIETDHLLQRVLHARFSAVFFCDDFKTQAAPDCTENKTSSENRAGLFPWDRENILSFQEIRLCKSNRKSSLPRHGCFLFPDHAKAGRPFWIQPHGLKASDQGNVYKDKPSLIRYSVRSSYRSLRFWVTRIMKTSAG